MSHMVAEVVIPPCVDIEKAVGQVMDYFRADKYDDETDEESKGDCDWWDYWQIGGRWSGNKTLAQFDKAKLDAFYAELNERKVTVSSFRAGKQELQPASQIPMVDALWREMMPGGGPKCLIFAHSGNSGTILDGNICTVKRVPCGLECERLIIAGLHWDDEKHPGELEAVDMLQTEFWNRVRHHKTDYDGNVKTGIAGLVAKQQEDLARWAEREHSSDEERVKHEQWLERKRRSAITDEWLVVTVDYHN